MASLEGKKILVVGGSSDMGLAAAQLAAKAGARVTIASRSAEKLAEAAKTLGPNATTRNVDVTDDKAVAAFFADGTVWDHVVCSVGAGGRGPIKEIDLQAAYAAMEGKFWAAFLVARHAKIAPDGTLTFVSGGLSQKPAAGAALIAAVNAALENMSRGLALEMAPIRVNTISPGPVDTPMWDRYTPEQKRQFLAGAASHVPLRRVAKPEEIGEVIIACMTSTYITGTVIPVDGGSTLA